MPIANQAIVINTLPLPTGAATEATVATLATEATAATLATEATVATLATEATAATLATEATVATLATEATAATLATEATVSTLATQATSASILAAFGGALQKTAFNELKVASGVAFAGWSFPYTVNSRLVTQVQTGGAPAVTTSGGKAQISVTGASQSNTLSSRRSINYVPGVGVTGRFTAPFAARESGLTQIVGIFAEDLLDGVGLCDNGTNFGFLIKSSAGGTASTFIRQQDWNIDPFNGSGPSGATFNPLLGHPFQIAFQWLGFGIQGLFIEQPSTGLFYPAHIVEYAGTSQYTWCKNPELVALANISTTAGYAGAGATLQSPSAMLFKDGSYDVHSISVDWQASGTKRVTVAGTELPVISLQNQTTYAAVTNRMRITLKEIAYCATVAAGTPRSVVIRAYRGTNAQAAAALNGEAFASLNANSCIFVDTTAGTVDAPSLALMLEVYQYRTMVPMSDPINVQELAIDLIPGETLIFTAALTTSTGGGPSADVEITPRWMEPA